MISIEWNTNIFILILYLTLRLSQLCVGFLISGPKLFHRILAHFCVHKLACRHIFILSGLELKREKCGREKKGFNIQMWKQIGEIFKSIQVHYSSALHGQRALHYGNRSESCKRYFHFPPFRNTKARP